MQGISLAGWLNTIHLMSKVHLSVISIVSNKDVDFKSGLLHAVESGKPAVIEARVDPQRVLLERQLMN